MKAIVLAGGSGTRLWPLSRKNYPKQFLRITGELSLFQQTMKRLLRELSPSDMIVMTNREYKFLVHSEIQGLFRGGSHKILPQVVFEPVSRNTAPAIALAMKYCLEELRCDEEEILFISPSDHVIHPEDQFIEYLRQAEAIAKRGYVVTFGIYPSLPKTGYGYIMVGEAIADSDEELFYKVERFVEKPDLETAKRYLAEQKYYWNSGMFAFQIGVMLNEMQRFIPEIGNKLKLSYEELLKDFENLPDISIDYAVMERSSNIAMLPLKLYWNDVGSWDALYEIMEKDQWGNIVKGEVIPFDTKNSLILGNKRLIATIGIEDLVIIETDDALLIAKKDQVQKVKDVVNRLKSLGKRETEEHLTIYRPWGSFTVLEEGLRYKIKRLTINPKERLSLQRHYHRSEHWVVVKGTAKVEVNDREVYLTENESVYVPKTAIHRLENPGSIPVEIIEVQIGEYIEEDDIERFDDKYGRDNVTK
ncbi:MAG: mannose-1-phosphate guanylyltransferase/mannose-6-phosphate isomerase [Caldimicrobium sp.]|nr:mannose-1-phosphate guanylyltransferase/mannose-6-phosphate isomerase [Caldimicrobium sp.]MDW8182137.1 mannose-1-phosphate guanylyltransferase/mannose-6-phosphate isomerase [Caldimicrobium sp.]